MKNKKIIGIGVIVVLVAILVGIYIYYNHEKKEVLDQVHTYFQDKETISRVLQLT